MPPEALARHPVQRDRPLRILTWHIHGAYLYYLSQSGHEIFLPTRDGGADSYLGRTPAYDWPDNVHEIPAERVRDASFNLVLFQHRRNWLDDQFEILSEAQRRLPRIYLEHDPPRDHPSDTRHPVDDPQVLLVHCTHFNDLMWDSGSTPTRVIDHGVLVPHGVRYSGELPLGLVVVNGMRWRGRRLGADLFLAARDRVPLDLVGMQAEQVGGLGEVQPRDLARFASRYRFFFHPVRWTSLGLAVLEAMAIGMPIVGLATTELVTVIENGVSGYVSTSVDELVAAMQRLIDDPRHARELGENARALAGERFGIDRFVRDWDEAFVEAMDLAPSPSRRGVHVSAPLEALA
ncbi:MAG TPA: glycosyltransferase family 4 protein [Candidatus Limnocylindria bacterium]|nr:glycosyltransferase family 4 protein [Candidatus Limnocylindria bacterium]